MSQVDPSGDPFEGFKPRSELPTAVDQSSLQSAWDAHIASLMARQDPSFPHQETSFPQQGPNFLRQDPSFPCQEDWAQPPDPWNKNDVSH